MTRSPLRAARRSNGGFGRFNDGGCGGPIVAHALNRRGAVRTRNRVRVERLMQTGTEYQSEMPNCVQGLGMSFGSARLISLASEE